MGFLKKLLTFDSDISNNSHSTKYNPLASNYKMETLDDIERIPVPTKKFEYNCDFTESIEYVLQRKATKYKKEGKMDLAIACLKKSNEIMPFAPMSYAQKDYERLEKYLRLAGKFDDAREAEKSTKSAIIQTKKALKEKRLMLSDLSDYIEVQRSDRACPDCAKYHDRIYSKNGKNGFPDSKIFVDYQNSKSCGCFLSFFPFYYGISTPTLSNDKNPREYSNRPFIDDRTSLERKLYEEREQKIASDTKDRADYNWLCENLPELAPKSFGGYRNMKNRNSENYKKLAKTAKEKGYTI